MNLRRIDLLFISIGLLLCSWHLDSSLNDNIISRAAMVAAVVEHGTFSIDPYHELTGDKARVGDHYYSEKAPLPSLLMIPIWWVISSTGLTGPAENGMLSEDLLRLSGLFCASLPLSLIMFWSWRQLRQTATPITATWMAALPFLGSFLFIYSGSFYGHLIAGLFVLYAWDDRRKGKPMLAGLLSAAAVLCEYSLFVFPLIWCLQDLARGRWRDLRSLVLGGIPALIVLFIMNAIVTGDPLALPYSQVDSHADEQRIFGLSFPSIRALFGLLISPYRGMIFFAPVTILCTIAIFKRIKAMRMEEILSHPLILPCLLLVLMISSHSMWWGGWALGPRHLTSVAVLLIAAGLPFLPADHGTGWLFLTLSFAGLIVNFAAKNTIWYGSPTDVLDPIRDAILPSFAARWFTELQWPVLLGASPKDSTFAFFMVFIAALIALLFLDRKWARQIPS